MTFRGLLSYDPLPTQRQHSRRHDSTHVSISAIPHVGRVRVLWVSIPSPSGTPPSSAQLFFDRE